MLPQKGKNSENKNTSGFFWPWFVSNSLFLFSFCFVFLWQILVCLFFILHRHPKQFPSWTQCSSPSGHTRQIIPRKPIKHTHTRVAQTRCEVQMQQSQGLHAAPGQFHSLQEQIHPPSSAFPAPKVENLACFPWVLPAGYHNVQLGFDATVENNLLTSVIRKGLCGSFSANTKIIFKNGTRPHSRAFQKVLQGICFVGLVSVCYSDGGGRRRSSRRPGAAEPQGGVGFLQSDTTRQGGPQLTFLQAHGEGKEKKKKQKQTWHQVQFV